MNTKKLFSLILTVCMLFSMASCGQPGTPSPPDSTPPDGANTTNNGQNQSSEFPLEKPITILTYYEAGGSADIVARLLSSVAPSILNQRVDVINMAGSGGLEAFDYLMKQPQDGYTLMIGTTTFLNMALTQDVPYDLDDFKPLLSLSRDVPIIFAKADGKYKSIDDVVAACKAEPGSVSMGHGRVNSTMHIVLQSLEREAGIETSPVPTSGGAEALSFVLGGHVDLGISIPSTLASAILSGDIIPIAIADEVRWTTEELSEAPTIKESGYNVVLPGNIYLMAYGDVPQERLDVLTEKFREAMNSDAGVAMWNTAKVVSGAELTVEQCESLWTNLRVTMTEYYRGKGELYEG